ncbi:YcxB family protein [Sphingobium yanoikuyae]|jgi:YcxB-like protein|uniref:YcxB family protein n=1 Tax=Sphingobium yanoikuyae TaxID=13690 RepID=UPI0022DD492C|nr:YcxB family protein [Sphingobium yanoikuyae]WBQ15601.1 YcxB family protein [Sphingobium yanoikuyae]
MAGQISLHATATDFVTASRANYLRQLRSRRFLGRLTFISVVAVLLMTGLFLFLGEGWRDSLFDGLYMALIVVAGILLFLGLTFLLLPRRVRRLFHQSKSQHGEIRADWSDDGCVWHRTGGEQHYAWTDYHRWFVARGCYLFYLNDQLYQFVPRHLLNAEQDADLHDTLMKSGLRRY